MEQQAPVAGTELDAEVSAIAVAVEPDPQTHAASPGNVSPETHASPGNDTPETHALPGNDTPATMPVRPPEAGLSNVSEKREAHTNSNPALAKTAENNVPATHRTPADSVQQDVSVPTVVLIAAAPTVVAGSSTGPVALAKSPAATIQKGCCAPVAQANNTPSQQTQPAGPVSAAANQGTVAHAISPPDSSSETPEEAPCAKDAFSGVAVSVAHSEPPAAMFTPFLSMQPPSTSHSHLSTELSLPVSDSVSGRVSSSPDGAPPQTLPVRRLEIAVQDPVLGHLDVRAEMRGGALHATLTGSQDSAVASMPSLHQFLQGHDVNVQSLTYATAREGVMAPGSTTFGQGDMRRDTAGGSGFSGGSHSDSHTPKNSQQQQYDSSDTAYEESLFGTGYQPQPLHFPAALVASNMLARGSTLSIHI